MIPLLFAGVRFTSAGRSVLYHQQIRPAANSAVCIPDGGRIVRAIGLEEAMEEPKKETLGGFVWDCGAAPSLTELPYNHLRPSLSWLAYV